MWEERKKHKQRPALVIAKGHDVRSGGEVRMIWQVDQWGTPPFLQPTVQCTTPLGNNKFKQWTAIAESQREIWTLFRWRAHNGETFIHYKIQMTSATLTIPAEHPVPPTLLCQCLSFFPLISVTPFPLLLWEKNLLPPLKVPAKKTSALCDGTNTTHLYQTIK